MPEPGDGLLGWRERPERGVQNPARGRAANVIPDYTRASFQVRSVTSEQLTGLVERVVACAEAACPSSRV